MDPSNPSHCCFHGHGTASFNERKSRIMKWFGKIFGGTGHRVSNGHCPCLTKENSCHGPATRAMDDQSKAENEDLDHAMALSLADDAKKQNGYKGHDHNDDLAKAIQESLRISSKPPNNSTQFSPRGYKVCGGCKQEISNGHYLSCIGRLWHPQCFCCYACHQPIRDREFSLSGNQAYHKSCYKELHHPKCEVCYQFIPTNKAGLIEYRVHPFWRQRYCPSHEHDKTPRCCSCERMESRGVKYISLGDGRSLCLECLDSAVMDTGECQPLYHSIRDYYEGMGMKIDQQIPMLLVEKQALNEAMEGEKNGRRHMPETRGLCLSEEQTVSSILEKPKIDANRTLGMRSCPQKLSPRCEVTAILALHGLPRLLTGSILAHELMHGWFRLKGYRKLRPEVEEGICQVLSHMWLEYEIMPVSTRMPSSSPLSFPSSTRASMSEVEKKLGEFFMNQIVHDMSPVYGGGFKAANAAVNKYGLPHTLDHVRLTGDLPV